MAFTKRELILHSLHAWRLCVSNDKKKTDSVQKDKCRNKCPNYSLVGSIPAMDLSNYDNAETEGGVAEN